jgi:hypothetical protein
MRSMSKRFGDDCWGLPPLMRPAASWRSGSAQIGATLVARRVSAFISPQQPSAETGHESRRSSGRRRPLNAGASAPSSPVHRVGSVLGAVPAAVHRGGHLLAGEPGSELLRLDHAAQLRAVHQPHLHHHLRGCVRRSVDQARFPAAQHAGEVLPGLGVHGARFPAVHPVRRRRPQQHSVLRAGGNPAVVHLGRAVPVPDRAFRGHQAGAGGPPAEIPTAATRSTRRVLSCARRRTVDSQLR